jgi:tRNA threonylcarbamoyl adenosine modification protein (Sua5/YciO/YrdC/YwlC family)
MLMKVHPVNPPERRIAEVASVLNKGGVIICPTDTVYALMCAIDQKNAFEQICRIKKIAPAKATFSMLFDDLKHVSQFTAQISTPQYRLLKKHLPGPFTFILNAGSATPSHLRTKRKTLGIRIPDHAVCQALVQALGKPLFTTSLHSDDAVLDYYTDPQDIHDAFGKLVDIVIDAGPGTFEASTVVDLTTDVPEILRMGKGEL